MKRVIIGMSGGVDSSVAATLLKEQGYEVIGVTLKLFNKSDTIERNDAKYVCDKLSIEYISLDFTKEFKEQVMDNFAMEYFNGNTPNPCINCNKYLKFSAMFQKAIDMNVDYIATGHYAISEYRNDIDRYLLKKSKSIKKDQTYVLYNLTQEQLKKTIFPLGEFEDKTQIREIAKKFNLDIAEKADSQDICFIPEGNYREFLKNYDEYSHIQQGNIVDMNGNILGKHKGYINYTIGQRRGLGLAVPQSVFVVSIDKEKNEVIVGQEKDLYSLQLFANKLNWIMFDKLNQSMKVQVKTRYSSQLVDAYIEMSDEENVKVQFAEPQRAITKGQSVVFYDNEYVIGGGIIK